MTWRREVELTVAGTGESRRSGQTSPEGHVDRGGAGVRRGETPGPRSGIDRWCATRPWMVLPDCQGTDPPTHLGESRCRRR